MPEKEALPIYCGDLSTMKYVYIAIKSLILCQLAAPASTGHDFESLDVYLKRAFNYTFSFFGKSNRTGLSLEIRE